MSSRNGHRQATAACRWWLSERGVKGVAWECKRGFLVSKGQWSDSARLKLINQMQWFLIWLVGTHSGYQVRVKVFTSLPGWESQAPPIL